MKTGQFVKKLTSLLLMLTMLFSMPLYLCAADSHPGRVHDTSLAVYPTAPYTYMTHPSPDGTYTLRVRNLNLLDAEWLQLEISPADGDVFMLKPTVEDVAALNEQLVSVVIMTDRLTNNYTRSAMLTYYVYGHAVSIPVQLTA